MKKNKQLEQLLNELASEAILKRLLDDLNRIDREDLSRLLPEHEAVFLQAYSRQWLRINKKKEGVSLPSASAHDF